MRLRNKKTGVIGVVGYISTSTGDILVSNIHDQEEWYHYKSIAELNEEWEDAPEEEWRDVLEFEELYQVSNFGNVRTVKNGEAEMSQQENRNGYMTVHLRNKGVERRAMVHRLVAEAFIPNPDELRDVNHKNGDKSDNRVENLEWVSHSDNMAHSFRELGKNVRHIVQLDLDNNFIERWNSIIEASEATGICRTDIGECCRGNRKHTKGYKWKYEEDYEEPKDTNYWCIDSLGKIKFHSTVLDEVDGTPNNAMVRKIIGNYFDTREEAKQAVEKLKAFRRLKDKGFRFTITPGVGSLDIAPGKFQIEINADMPAKWFCCDAVQEDLEACFGGEE